MCIARKDVIHIALCACMLALSVLLTGCSKQLLGSLDEMAANQVVSALRVEGIDADKAPLGEKSWKVNVPDARFADAVQILERRNLPAQQFQGLGQVFKKESLVSTPTEERARMMYALSQELEHSLLEIDGVLAARVHPVILPQDPLNPKRAAATASVLIKYRAGTDVNSRESMIRALVSAGIEGLNYDDVRVVMVPAEVRTAETDKLAESSSVTSFGSGNSIGSEVGGGGGDRSGVSVKPTSLQRLVPSMVVGSGAAMVAVLSLMFVWVRWRRSAATTLRGRWEHTVNSLFVEPRQSRQHSGSP